MKNSHKFFENKECKYFPCHKDENLKEFNCLFCFCPLYLKEKCIGTPKYLKNNIKDCSNCTVPHNPINYEQIISSLMGKE